MVFCFQNCSDLLWEKLFLLLRKTFSTFHESKQLVNVATSVSNHKNSDGISCVYKVFINEHDSQINTKVIALSLGNSKLIDNDYIVHNHNTQKF